MFSTRWRWNRRRRARAAALPRRPARCRRSSQRMDAEDLLAAVFPDQVACAENLVGEREIPDHPLVAPDDRTTACTRRWTSTGWSGCCAASSPATIARRRARPDRAVAARARGADRAALRLPRRRAARGAPHAGGDEPALARPGGRRRPRPARSRGDRARARARPGPTPRNADELHDALVWLGFLTEAEAQADAGLARLAARAGAASGARRGCMAPGATLWVAAERLPQFQALCPDARLDPAIAAPPASDARGLVARRRAGRDPARPARRARARSRRARSRRRSGSTPDDIAAALAALEAEGFAMRGRFTPDAGADEWCERRLLARIHRYTVKRLRAEIEPVAARDFLRFLFDWQRVDGRRAHGRARTRSTAVVAQLEGFEAPAGAWETEILPARIADYEPAWLDDLCLAGRIAWTRLRRATARERRRARRGAGAHDADRAAAAPPRAALDVARRRRRDAAAPSAARAGGRRLHPRSTAPRSSTSSSTARGLLRTAGRGGAGRAGRARPRAPPTASAACARCWCRPSAPPAAGGARRRRAAVRHGGCRPLGAGAPRPAAAARTAGRTRGGRARRAHAAAPLRRRVLAPARARGRLAAAVARPAARLPPARGARRDPRRPLRRRLLRRAVRAARGGRRAARGAPQAGRRAPGSRCPAPTRSTSSAS